MTRKELKAKIDGLGRLRGELTMLKASERELSAEVEQAMAAAKLATLSAEIYSAQLAERKRLKIDPAKFRKKTGDAVFLQCASISVSQARAHLSEADLAKLGDYQSRTELRISELPSGK